MTCDNFLGRLSRAAVLALVVEGASGCGRGRPAWQIPPKLDPAATAQGAMAAADADGDGRLDANEMLRVPALRQALARLDSDGDKRLSAAEITAWLEEVKQAGVASADVSLAVTHKGRPLAGAMVRLVPEKFMGDEMRAGSSVTDDRGLTYMVTVVGDRQTPGINCGLYRVEITGKGNDGLPLPAKYNTETTLGIAVGAGAPVDSTTNFALD